MTRNRKKTGIDFSDECMEAYDRLTTLAHQVASLLTGDPLSPETGRVQTPRSLALAMGMICFLLRTDPGDLEAMFFADGSLNQLPFTPGVPAPMRHPPLADMVY